MNIIPYPFLIYLKKKGSPQFEYASDVINAKPKGQRCLITFKNGMFYSFGADNVRFYHHISTREDVRIYEDGTLNKEFNIVDNYGKYLIFRSNDSCSEPIDKSSRIEICDIKEDTYRSKSIISYFKEILNGSNDTSFDIKTEDSEGKGPNRISSGILLRALDKIDILESSSALSNYLDGTLPLISKLDDDLIYPFGCNESQKLAVEMTLQNNISIIEGPPGTGKTQTILNIVANLIAQEKTVAIVSNNNAAVFNVLEKLEKYGCGMVAASLGSNNNKSSFFESLKEQTVDSDFRLSKDILEKAKNKIRDLDGILTECFQYKNRLASLKTQLSDTEVEFNHIKAEQPLLQNIKTEIDSKFHRSWNISKTLKIKAFLSDVDFTKSLTFITKLRLIVLYGFFDIKGIYNYSDALLIYINHKFYELSRNKIVEQITEVDNWLTANNEESNLNELINASKDVFNSVLYEKYVKLKTSEFTLQNYIGEFTDFIKHYPVILSSTLSLHNSIPKGYLFDYLIIDESSQVDIIKSAVCFSCCRNVVIVGDSKQLSHIIDRDDQQAAQKLQVSYDIDPAYNYVEKNILNSLKCLYGDRLKTVILKEHYRCHPTIIGFCNKKYYNNELVIMTENSNLPFKIIETNISGCRDNHNQRQIDETDLYIRDNHANDYTEVGVISPYRDHANMLCKRLPSSTEADTIHKYQGREKNTIIFNTVKSQINNFIDNPNLINVAVSRAINEFIVVKPASMNLPHGTNIGDLIRYICYTTDPEKVVFEGKIRSVFDLLYKEYNKMFADFIMSNKNINGSPAEVIIHKLLEKLLENSEFSSIDFVQEYKLMDLVKDYQLLTEDEITYIKNNSRLDFLLYNKIDKSPVLAIEVDGVSFHSSKLQQARDRNKNRIMEITGLPLLRLATDGHSEESQIIERLQNAMKLS